MLFFFYSGGEKFVFLYFYNCSFACTARFAADDGERVSYLHIFLIFSYPENNNDNAGRVYTRAPPLPYFLRTGSDKRTRFSVSFPRHCQRARIYVNGECLYRIHRKLSLRTFAKNRAVKFIMTLVNPVGTCFLNEKTRKRTRCTRLVPRGLR